MITHKHDFTDWERFDDYMIYNESEKRVIIWRTYGDDKYFISEEYYYEGDDFLDTEENDMEIIINEKITEENTLTRLIEKTLEMRL